MAAVGNVAAHAVIRRAASSQRTWPTPVLDLAPARPAAVVWVMLTGAPSRACHERRCGRSQLGGDSVCRACAGKGQCESRPDPTETEHGPETEGEREHSQLRKTRVYSARPTHRDGEDGQHALAVVRGVGQGLKAEAPVLHPSQARARRATLYDVPEPAQHSRGDETGEQGCGQADRDDEADRRPRDGQATACARSRQPAHDGHRQAGRQAPRGKQGNHRHSRGDADQEREAPGCSVPGNEPGGEDGRDSRPDEQWTDDEGRP